jgi:4-hydroxythreonine-4-phosphate dehydrogenase
LKKVAISIGDLNGIGIEIALKAHKKISKMVKPVYIIDKSMLKQACKKLDIAIPKNFKTISPKAKKFKIKPGVISKKSGKYSFLSFIKAVKLTEEKKVDAVLTLPIHKKAWEKAGLNYVGHTDFLREYFKKDAIMMLGCNKLYTALYTEHIPLKDVAKQIKSKQLTKFLLDFAKSIETNEQIAVLGLNPHAGDGGVLGDEEQIIEKAIKKANKKLNKELFVGAIVPDIAFTPNFRKNYRYFVAMYHDQGLAPLKALYFDESINVSLNLPILRVSVDHGTAFDIAYKGKKLNLKSYINAIKYIAKER